MITVRIRLSRPDEIATILAIVNAAAIAYRGVIPDDCWHEPYMSREELESEIAAGVVFWGYEVDGELSGVMAIQHVRDVDPIRHAYVLPNHQGRGVGTKLLTHLQNVLDDLRSPDRDLGCSRASALTRNVGRAQQRSKERTRSA
jgi:GNAT superfamily N-acetyltransferase